MSPPSTRVWLFRSTTEVSASRFLKVGELVGGWFSPTELTSCLTSSATVPFSPMRGVTVRMTPASRYSTVWLTPPVVIVVLVPPPGSVPGELIALVCWLVMIGTESDTLMTAFLFSDVITCGFETMLTLFSLASALSIAMNWSVANVNAVSPAPKGPRTAAGPATPVGSVTGPAGGADVGRPPAGPVLKLPTLMRRPPTSTPERTAQSTPSRVSSVSVTSATSTSIRTWRGIRSSCLIVFSISVQLRGKVVTITALVTSSAIKRTWPSARTSDAPWAAAVGLPGGGGGVYGGGGGAGGAGRRGVGAAPGVPGPAPAPRARAPESAIR